MAFLTRIDKSRLYVLRITTVDGTVIHKVGMCNSSRATDRMLEILRSWFNTYRYVPHTVIKLDMGTVAAYKLEQYIHSILKPFRYNPVDKTDGSSEMFVNVDECRLLWFVRCCINSKFSVSDVVDEDTACKLEKLLRVKK